MITNSGLVRAFDERYDAADFNGMFVVGLAGLRGSGKSTIAVALCEELSSEGVNAARFSFAGRVKEVASALIGSSQWEKDDLLYSGNNWDMRQFLMQFGTEFVRDNLGENFWVDIIAQQILEQKPSVAVIDDMRFPNEYVFVRALGAGVLVEREGSGLHSGTHRSEMPDALGISAVVSNNADVSDAVRSVRAVVSGHPQCPF